MSDTPEVKAKVIDGDDPLTYADSPKSAEPGSVVARLRELRDSFSSDDTHDLDVPGYRGELVARYAVLPWEVIRQLAIRGERGKRDPNIAPTLAADGIANAVVGFYFREGDNLVPVTWQGDPVERYDGALASVLGLENVKTSREITKAVFPDELSLVAHYGALMEWQSERDEEVDGQVVFAARTDDAVHPTSRSSVEPPS